MVKVLLGISTDNWFSFILPCLSFPKIISHQFYWVSFSIAKSNNLNLPGKCKFVYYLIDVEQCENALVRLQIDNNIDREPDVSIMILNLGSYSWSRNIYTYIDCCITYYFGNKTYFMLSKSWNSVLTIYLVQKTSSSVVLCKLLYK